MKILIAEDQITLNEILKERLTRLGFIVDTVFNGEDALVYIQKNTYNMIILDIMMPKKSGIDVLKTLRLSNYLTPVLMLTAKDQIDDRVKGLNLGADDYLIKPFAFDELVARIHALNRRKDKTLETVLRCADLTINTTTMTVERSNQMIELSKKEYLILEYLLRHKNEVVSRKRLEDISTDMSYDGYSNVIDVYINFIRKKVDSDFDYKIIHTVRGFGYAAKDPL